MGIDVISIQRGIKPQMRPTIKSLNQTQRLQTKCKMCSKHSRINYNFTSSFTKTYVGIVCKTCCMNEYYGKKGKAGRLYQKDIQDGTLFGIKKGE